MQPKLQCGLFFTFFHAIWVAPEMKADIVTEY